MMQFSFMLLKTYGKGESSRGKANIKLSAYNL